VPQIEAAGGVLWRGDPAGPEVALVHRPKYDDWSLPKGKLDPGEHPLLGGLREIAEETGFAARPGRRIGSLRYTTLTGPKRVRYWACEASAGEFAASREVDELWWGPLPAALGRLAPEHDRRILELFAADTRRTRALAVVRHASAGDRATWRGADADRPLDPGGEARAATVAALLSAYDVRRAGVADVLRCRQTLDPFGRAAGVEVDVLPATTAGAYEGDPAAGSAEVAALLDGPGGAAWCGQREVIPDLVAGLTSTWGDGRQDASGLAHLAKGALALLHLDDRSRLVALERLPG
jgi:8-oxo-dGTP pyrophosphatase MutT (NUDIX family)/phosphohistidine phosphatase SixA